MRKQTKLVAVLSATALLAIGASAVAFAEGWDASTGEWQWLDKDGIAVSNEWKKSGNDWFYLGDDGNMVVDSIVEDTRGTSTKYYYVNEQGAMVSNTWKAIDNIDSDYDCDYFWYYFGADGKAYTSNGTISTSKIKEINGKKYAFDNEGKMLYGWVSAGADGAIINEQEDAWQDATYYFGDWTDGALRTGWQQIPVVDNNNETQNYWFYFDNNGKKQFNKEKKIDGKAYLFAQDGHMLDDWANATVSEEITSTSSVVFLNGDGSKRTKTWVWAVPAKEYDETDYDNDEASWWYVGANGTVYTDRIQKINGKRYAFDEIGRMMTGLVAAETNDNINYTNITGGIKGEKTGVDFAQADFGTDKKVYLFGATEDGSMKYGYQNVEFDDDIYQMYFNTTSGVGSTEYVSKIKKFTANGIVLKANADSSNYGAVKATYAEKTGYSTPDVDADLIYYGTETKGKVLVNTSGSIMKNKTNMKDVNDYYYCTDKNGVVTYVGNQRVRKFDEKKDKVENSVYKEGLWVVIAD